MEQNPEPRKTRKSRTGFAHRNVPVINLLNTKLMLKVSGDHAFNL